MENRAVIFDCDGVLVDSEVLSAAVVCEMARELGALLDQGRTLELIRGRKVALWVRELGEMCGRSLDGAFVTEFRARSAALFDERLCAVPGVEGVVSALDLPYCTASSAPLDKINRTLGITGLRRYFSGRIYSAYEVGIWKPDPGLFLHAAKDMGAEPKMCAVVEDSMVGVQAGVAAGMTVFAYVPEEESEKFTRVGATAFHSMDVLPTLLDEWKLGRNPTEFV